MERLIDRIIEVVSEETRVSVSEMWSKNRHEEIVDARMLVVYVAMRHFKLSSCVIGRYVGATPQAIRYMNESFEDRMKARRYLEIAHNRVMRTFAEMENKAEKRV